MTLPEIISAWIILLAVWSAGAAGQGDSCTPSCPEDCTPGVSVPNPRNCAQYHTCLQGCQPSDVAFDCPEGHKFDIVTAECQPEGGGVTCGYCLPRCVYTCHGHEGLAANRGDCHNAWLCTTDPPLIIVCGEQFFNGTACQDDEDQCCDPCEVFCEAPFTEVMDPTDCHSFYYCAEVGYPLPEDRYECPDGEVFLPEEGLCGEGGECNQPCTSG